MKRKITTWILLLVMTMSVLNGCTSEKAGIVVLFNPGYDGATSFSQEVQEGQNLQMPDIPEREGYVFKGWFRKLEDGSFEETAFDFIENTVTEPFALYAKWSKNAKDKQKNPKEPDISYENGVLTVELDQDYEVSFNDGDYSDQKTFVCDYADRVKIDVRRKETETLAESENLTIYYTVCPNVNNFKFSAPSGSFNTASVKVSNSDMYEYQFEGSKEWRQGTVFTNLMSQGEQKVYIRVRRDGKYPHSEVVQKKISVNLDTDTDLVERVSYIWGGSEDTATITQNTAAKGLCGTDSIRSIKIKDKDITAYNDYAIRIPEGYDAFSADVKLYLNTRSAITKDLPITNGTGQYLGAIKLNEWQKIYASGGDWIVTFAFPELVGGETNPAGSATIYIDNIVFYTKQEVENGTWNPTCWVENSIGTGDDDAKADMESKFDITLGTSSSLYKNFRNRYVIQTNASLENGSHMVKVKAPKVKDISQYNGVSFVIDMQMAGGATGGTYPLYLVKKGTTYTAAELKDLSNLSNTDIFTKIHDYKIDIVGGTFNGAEIVTISNEQLKAAGYDLTDLDDLTFIFRDVELSGSWWNIYNVFLYGFKLY